MSDALGCQFRYVQIVTRDTDPNRPRAFDGTGGFLPDIPYVDPPRGGYEAAGRADNAPFYENDDGTGPFPYPNYSGVLGTGPVHDEATGTVRLKDMPGISPSSAITFETYVVYVNPDLRAEAPAMFVVLAGFRWTVTSDAAGTATVAEATGNAGITDIRSARGGDGAAIDRINAALGNSGFSAGFAWQATSEGNLMPCVPGPSGLALLAVGGGLLLRFRRRPPAAAAA